MAEKTLFLRVALALAASKVVIVVAVTVTAVLTFRKPASRLSWHTSPNLIVPWSTKLLVVLPSEQAFKGAYSSLGSGEEGNIQITNFRV